MRTFAGLRISCTCVFSNFGYILGTSGEHFANSIKFGRCLQILVNTFWSTFCRLACQTLRTSLGRSGTAVRKSDRSRKVLQHEHLHAFTSIEPRKSLPKVATRTFTLQLHYLDSFFTVQPCLDMELSASCSLDRELLHRNWFVEFLSSFPKHPAVNPKVQ